MTKILFITPSNIGDVILTLPALDYLKEKFPTAQITCLTAAPSREIFQGMGAVNKLIIFDKKAKFREKFRLFRDFAKEKFDIIIDFRNTLFGALLPARFKTSPFLMIPKAIWHMQERNFYRLQKALKIRFPLVQAKDKLFYANSEDKEHVSGLLKKNGISLGDKIVVISPGAGGNTRRWEPDKFVSLCQKLIPNYKIILVGSKAYQELSNYIFRGCPGVIDFTGLTNLRQLSCLLEAATFLVSPDTGTLQLGSYMNTPIVALFGPSDERKYGPWSDKFSIVKKELFCLRCATAQCKFGAIECMKLIKVEDVLCATQRVLSASHLAVLARLRAGRGIRLAATRCYKRILIVRTDRIGDVVLSTPVIKALRDNYPNAYIAMIVSPHAKDIVETNPYLDVAIIYDKDYKHKSWASSLKFVFNLKKRKFDLAIILHPTNRVHLVTFLAGIPKRVGYNRKLGFLLTDKIKHTKQEGAKHELEYNLDLVRYLEINPEDKDLLVPIKAESEEFVDDLFRQEGISPEDKLLAIHPGASCPSKLWPAERFAQVADKLVEKYSCKVLIISGPKDIALTEVVAKNMRHNPVNLGGKTSVSQLASVLKRCRLFISNDSGPVHIATAVGTPVISIFGRNQAGLSFKRWGPLGAKDKVLHKEVGCVECLAHNCLKDFACLKAISVEDVLNAVDLI